MAEQMYRKGVKVDPRSYRAHINLIVYLSEHGEYKNLIEWTLTQHNIYVYFNV